MKYVIKLEEYKKEEGLKLKWEDDFSINISYENGSVCIAANKTGLISLANHLLTLAQDSVEKGNHIHLDEYNSLEENSIELILEKL